MTRLVNGHIISETKFSFPFRMILAGSSGSGKTYFAGELLKRNNLFEEAISNIYYYYPCYLKESPVDWHQTLDIPVIYNFGLPSKEDLTKLPKNSCVVLDDSFDEAVKSSAIDHLFRVISGKRRLAVMIMTQNNFTKGKYGREIRNCCNFSVLFRNCCDTSINENIARMAGLSKAFSAAKLDLTGVEYPYMFIDQSQRGQLTPYRLYTNIFSRFPEVWSDVGMKGYVIGAQDFDTFFKSVITGKTFSAQYNEIETKEKNCGSNKAIVSKPLEISDWDTSPETDQYSQICKTTKSESSQSDSDSRSADFRSAQGLRAAAKPRARTIKRKSRSRSSIQSLSLIHI